MDDYIYDGQVDRDGWGPCCRVCGSRGQAYKPCGVCIRMAREKGIDAPDPEPARFD